MTIYTIGYGGRSPEEIVGMLKDAGIAALVDVRLRPDRASMGCFAKAKTPDKGIEAWLARAAIPYASLVELGNVFVDLEDWRARYAELLDSSGGLLTRRLRGLPIPFCLMCAEKAPEDCHRSQIAEYLAREGHEVKHLR